MRCFGRWAGIATLALTASMALGLVRYAAADEPDVPSTARLPAPFRDWDVRLTPHPDNPRVLDLVFNSPALRRRITNRVYLPGGYQVDGARWPVMYYLHGSDVPALDNETLRPVTRQEYLANDISAGGGAAQTDLFDFDKPAERARFLVVAPDTSIHEAICETCFWFDGRPHATPNVHPVTAVTLAADSFLHNDLYPLVEALFHARADRGGRGVMGFSMGAMAAYQQGMMHPDQYIPRARSPAARAWRARDSLPLPGRARRLQQSDVCRAAPPLGQLGVRSAGSGPGGVPVPERAGSLLGVGLRRRGATVQPGVP